MDNLYIQNTLFVIMAIIMTACMAAWFLFLPTVGLLFVMGRIHG